MTSSLFYLLPAAIPCIYFSLGTWLRRSPTGWPAWLAFLPAVLAIGPLLLLLSAGPGQSPLLGVAGVGISLRVDALSATLLLLVTFIGGTVLHFSRQYLAGNARHGVFLQDLAYTLGAVSTLIVAGNLYLLVAAWIAMSLLLNRLLVFCGDRPMAQLAARKKFILARFGDLSLLAASGILIAEFGTADLQSLQGAFVAAGGAGEPQPAMLAAAGLLALTALLKSAQFPTHGWLVEVMETPTPVSALLHAGIVNAGGFLVLRFSDLFAAQVGVGLTIAAIGAITAVVGTAIMLVQTNIKSALAYSTVGQMGFMMLQCGLGAYSAAMLHLVGHSLYKAHAFLASGDAVRRVRSEGWRDGARAAAWRTGAFNLVLLLLPYLLVTWASGFDWSTSPVIFAMGLVLMAGLWLYLDAPGASLRQRFRMLATAALIASVYVAAQASAAWLFADALAAAAAPGAVARGLLVAVLLAFAGLTLLQGRPLQSTAWRKLRVHLAQGLYINLVLNRLLGAFRAKRISTP